MHHERRSDNSVGNAAGPPNPLWNLGGVGPVRSPLEVYDPHVAIMEAVLEHRKMLVAVRTLALHHIQEQIAKLPIEIHDQLVHDGKIESPLRRLERVDTSVVSTIAGTYRLEWLVAFIDQDRTCVAKSDVSKPELDDLLDQHGTTLRDEPGHRPDRRRNARLRSRWPDPAQPRVKFARWRGTGAVALSSGKGSAQPVRHRLDDGGNRRINSVLYIASVT